MAIVASTAQLIGDHEKAQAALETLLRHNPYHVGAYVRLGHLLHNQQQYMQAAESYQKAISLMESGWSGPSVSGTWAALAHCWLLLDDLPRAFNAYQQALGYPGGARDSTLWFGVGLLYDRYGADEHALEAFCAALKLEECLPCVSDNTPSPMVREMFYRIGYLLRNRKRTDTAIKCFEYCVHFPPAPLQRADSKIQLAITYEAAGDVAQALNILRPITKESRRAVSTRAKTLLGWYMVKDARCDAAAFEEGLALLKTVVHEDPSDALAWYFLGRTHVLLRAYTPAYEAYQEAVYRDGTNAAFWNSIGILYSEIRQFRDALDAFSRAIHQNPSIPECWWNLGILYEGCNGQRADAIDAYQKAAELAPNDSTIKGRLLMLKELGNEEPSSTLRVEVSRRELDPFSYITRSILLGAAQIPPQRTSAISPCLGGGSSLGPILPSRPPSIPAPPPSGGMPVRRIPMPSIHGGPPNHNPTNISSTPLSSHHVPGKPVNTRPTAMYAPPNRAINANGLSSSSGLPHNIPLSNNRMQ